ncbi:UNVERIFIED_CONTAM: hypothetical protein GTU68_056367 [Idotea baltica]|nr:hypothetical protein [Idotea baltica]
MQHYPSWFGLTSSHNANFINQVSFADAVTTASPAIVNLYTSKYVNKEENPLLNDPKFSLGSAVIMSKEGYLLTNNHVTDGADQIIVALKDGRETAATLIGSDPETDLAVLKIDLDNLQTITLGHSDSIRIGDIALAIGNPFGVGQTVTMGIISATGRNQLGLNTYEDFIQTDAAINPGNSGGALLNARGHLIGISTAIFSKSGGSQGIGFAIPVKLANYIMHAIIKDGKVTRGWLGIEVQTLTPELAESLHAKNFSGILVAGVYSHSPAEKAGLQPGDLILSINNKKATDWHTSMDQVALTKPGQKVTINIVRNGQVFQLMTKIGLRPPFTK